MHGDAESAADRFYCRRHPVSGLNVDLLGDLDRVIDRYARHLQSSLSENGQFEYRPSGPLSRSQSDEPSV